MPDGTMVDKAGKWSPLGVLVAAAWARRCRPLLVIVLTLFGWGLGRSVAAQVERPVADPKACTRDCGIPTPTPTHIATGTSTPTPTPTPTPTASNCSTISTLCLGGGRFLVEATWTKPDGESGQAQAVALTANSGFFWFFDANNVEVAVKVLNGCSVNGHFWVFSAGLTNLEVAMTVTDTATNKSKTYSNPQGTPFQTVADTTTFAACPAGGESSAIGNPEEPSQKIEPPKGVPAMALPDSSAGCVGSDTVLCLSGRFQIEAKWQTASGGSGAGHGVNLTPESGYFWFFDPSNVELVVKVLDACAIGSGPWFFGAGMTTVGVQLKVTDTLSGAVKNYGSASGTPFPPILDTSAFSDCPSSVALTVDRVLCPPPGVLVGPGFANMGFRPINLIVRVGDTVTWTFEGGDLEIPQSHSITSDDGIFDSGVQRGTFTFSRTFTEAGTFAYHCSVGHPTLVVNRLACHPLECCVITDSERGVVVVNP
jgi:hypothetical protein